MFVSFLDTTCVPSVYLRWYGGSERARVLRLLVRLVPQARCGIRCRVQPVQHPRRLQLALVQITKHDEGSV